MSKAPADKPATVAEILRRRGLATMDREASEAVVRSVGWTLRRMGQGPTADALSLAVSNLRGASADSEDAACEHQRRLKEEAYAKIEALTAIAARLRDVERDLAAQTEARRHLTAWQAEVRATLGEVDALGPIEEPLATSAAIRDLAAERDRWKALRDDDDVEQARTLGTVLGLEFADGFVGWPQMLDAVGRIQGERDRLNAELDAMAQRAVCGEVYAPEPTQESESEKVEAAFEGHRIETTDAPDGEGSPVVAPEGEAFRFAVPPGASASIEREEGPEPLAQPSATPVGTDRAGGVYGTEQMVDRRIALEESERRPRVAAMLDEVGEISPTLLDHIEVSVGSLAELLAKVLGGASARSASAALLKEHHLARSSVALGKWVRAHAENVLLLRKPEDQREYRAQLTGRIQEAVKGASRRRSASSSKGAANG